MYLALPPRRRSRGVVVCTLVTFALAACGGGTKDDGGKPTPHSDVSAPSVPVGTASMTVPPISAASSSTPPSSTSSTSTSPPPTTPPAPATALPTGSGKSTISYGGTPPASKPQQAVYLAYANYWALLGQLGQHPTINNPGILRYTTGSVRTNLIVNMRSYASQGKQAIGPIRLRPSVMSVSGSTASVSDCVDQRGVITYINGKRQAGTGDIATYLTLLTFEDGRWLVSAATNGAANSCS